MHFRMHPQLSSLRKALAVAKSAYLRNKVVLDCFCGTGTLVYAAFISGARRVIGTDIEDWSKFIYPKLREIMLYSFYRKNIVIEWKIDAFDAVRKYEHDVLFTDPPNPFTLTGGCFLSVVRDTGLSGWDLHRMWITRLNKKNLMGKGWQTILYLKRLFELELDRGCRVIVNLFTTNPHGNNKRNLAKIFSRYFKLKQVYETYFELEL